MDTRILFFVLNTLSIVARPIPENIVRIRFYTILTNHDIVIKVVNFEIFNLSPDKQLVGVREYIGNPQSSDAYRSQHREFRQISQICN